MQVYVEYLSLRTFFGGVLKELQLGECNSDKIRTYFYIDATRLGKTIGDLIGKLFKFEFKKLEFEMRYIKDERGELIRLRIPGKDLFDFQAKIINSEAFRSLYRDEWKLTRVADFAKKGLIDGSIMDVKSVSRALYLIQIVVWHRRKAEESRSVLLLSQRAWWDVFEQYALHVGISLKSISSKRTLFFDSSMMRDTLRKYPRLYMKLKNYKYVNLWPKPTVIDASVPKLFLDGRGDVNLKKNGHHSDFFWFLNSDYPARNILYDYHSEEERLYLKRHGINAINKEVITISDHNVVKISPPNKRGNLEEESKKIDSLITSYDFTKSYWLSLFQTYGVKIFLTWQKYDNHHIAIADAIKECGGVSAMWQMAFDGYKSIGCYTNADIVFGFSNWSSKIERQLDSIINYQVITGYPKDYAPPLLKREAMALRSRLQENGAEKIVFVIDENSMDDSRWHTGHELQRENYSFILERVLATPWLGVVFKPKAAKTLRQRLGCVADLLSEVEKTGRCYVYESSGRHTTSAPPILAGLSADVCIHGHLSSGTAALECALEGIPTLLIDREGCPGSKLCELPEGKVVFRNWPETIDALMEHFQAPQGIPGFGDWSEIIDDLDPFRDGKAASRMGTYLHWLIQGYEEGLDKNIIMADAAERYSRKWGEDKIISG